MNIEHAVLLTALCVQLYNLGTIWFCQVVVYPLFAKVGAAEYVAYHRHYARQIPLPIIVPGFLSFAMPLLLLWFRPDSVSPWLALVNVAMGLIGLVVTVALEIPRHNRLERSGKLDRVIAELIRYNWPRTASITVSAGLTLAMAMQAFAPV